jgi:hypothetical protein
MNFVAVATHDDGDKLMTYLSFFSQEIHPTMIVKTNYKNKM